MANVINFHITERCMFNCIYCFAKFGDKAELTLEQWKCVVDNVNTYFKSNMTKNARINIAGGEPLMVPYLDELIDYIYSKGIDVSIITNGLLLDEKICKNVAKKVSMIGVSIDSIDMDTNKSIGRCTSPGKTVDLVELAKTLKYAKSVGIGIKINTVISKLNLYEDLGSWYKLIDPCRLKMLQMRINASANIIAEQYTVSNDEFDTHVNKYNDKVLVKESSEDMENAYVIIGPQGKLISNNENDLHVIGDCVVTDFSELMQIYAIDMEKFAKRY